MHSVSVVQYFGGAMYIDSSWQRIGEFTINSLSYKKEIKELNAPLTIELYAKANVDYDRELDFKAIIHDLDLWVDSESLEFSITTICNLLMDTYNTFNSEEDTNTTDIKVKYLNLFK